MSVLAAIARINYLENSIMNTEVLKDLLGELVTCIEHGDNTGALEICGEMKTCINKGDE